MKQEEVYFWQIHWAGRWMTTFTRFTEEAIKREHPDAIRVDDSLQVRIDVPPFSVALCFGVRGLI